MLTFEQQLDTFSRRLASRSRDLPSDAPRFTDAFMLPIAHQFLEEVRWDNKPTAEELVAGIRSRRAKKSGARRSMNARRAKAKAAAQAEAAKQRTLF